MSDVPLPHPVMNAALGDDWADLFTADQMHAHAAAVSADLAADNVRLREALQAMLTHMGMEEDEWNKPTFDQARKALAQ